MIGNADEAAIRRYIQEQEEESYKDARTTEQPRCGVSCDIQESARYDCEVTKVASSKEYLEFILEQLSGVNGVTSKQMMGEYILYVNGRIFGGIYDDRFLVKPTKSAAAMMPDADMELPYEGAKEMLLVDNVDNREFLTELVTAMYNELPMPKQRKKVPGGQHD